MLPSKVVNWSNSSRTVSFNVSGINDVGSTVESIKVESVVVGTVLGSGVVVVITGGLPTFLKIINF